MTKAIRHPGYFVKFVQLELVSYLGREAMDVELREEESALGNRGNTSRIRYAHTGFHSVSCVRIRERARSMLIAWCWYRVCRRWRRGSILRSCRLEPFQEVWDVLYVEVSP